MSVLLPTTMVGSYPRRFIFFPGTTTTSTVPIARGPIRLAALYRFAARNTANRHHRLRSPRNRGQR